MEISNRLKEIQSESGKILALQEGILKVAYDEKRELTPDEDAQYKKSDEDWKPLQIEKQRLIELADKQKRAVEQYKADQEAGGYNADSTEKPPSKKDAYRSVFERYIRSGMGELTPEETRTLRTGWTPDKEKADFTAGEKRAQTVTTSGGGYLIPTDLQKSIEKIMLYFGPMWDGMVTRELPTEMGNPLTIPTNDDTTNTGRLLAINTAVTTTDLVFGQVQLDAYKYSSDQLLVPFELLEDSAVPLDMFLFDELGERLGRILNTHLTTGTGSGQPNGAVTASAAGVTSAAAGAITRSDIIGLVHSVDRAYRNGPKVGFMFHDNILAAIKKLAIGSGDDRPLWTPSMREGEPDRLEGFPYWINNDMVSTIATTNKTMLFGNFDKYIVRKVGQMRLYRLEERYRDTDQTGFIAFMRADGELLTNKAVKRLTQA